MRPLPNIILSLLLLALCGLCAWQWNRERSLRELLQSQRDQLQSLTAERDDLTENEAHRVGEFDDLRDMMRDVLDKVNAIGDRTDAISERIDGIYDDFTDSVAQMVENGATVKENDDDAAEAIAQAAAEDLENLDYTL